MSDHDKMMAFGHWLSERKRQQEQELFALSVNARVPTDAIRVKAGHIESTTKVMEAFQDLYNNDLQKFLTEWLGQEPAKGDEEEDEKE